MFRDCDQTIHKEYMERLIRNTAEKHEQGGSAFYKLADDPRITPVGRFLRKTKLNELPQILNVLLGDMSIVGWRPLVPRGFHDYPPDIQKNIVKVRPGLTGIGSVVFRDEEAIVTEGARQGKDLLACYREDILPYKGALELWYAEHRSFWLDVKLIVATVWAIIRPHSDFYRRWFKDLPEPQSELVRRHTQRSVQAA